MHPNPCQEVAALVHNLLADPIQKLLLIGLAEEQLVAVADQSQGPAGFLEFICVLAELFEGLQE
jgi:hypothetical protein